MYGLSPQLRAEYESPAQIEAVSSVATEIVGAETTLTIHATQGLTTEVFDCETEERGYIARRGDNEPAFCKDRLAGEMLAGTLPVPRVVGITALKDASLVCVSERGSETTADETELYTPNTRLNTSLMHTMRVMHGVVAPQSGPVPKKFSAIKRHMATAAYDKVDADAPRAIDAQTLNEVAAVQRRLSTFTMSRLQRLCHNDIKGPNLLAEDQEITGVIDWAMAEFGDPASDLGALYVAHPDALDYNQYKADATIAHQLHQRVLFYAMATCVGSIRFYSNLENHDEVTAAEKRLISLANEAESV